MVKLNLDVSDTVEILAQRSKDVEKNLKTVLFLRTQYGLCSLCLSVTGALPVKCSAFVVRFPSTKSQQFPPRKLLDGFSSKLIKMML